MINTPITPTNLSQLDTMTDAQYREAPWSAKRLMLKWQLAQQTNKNEKDGIDTSVIVYDITDQKPVYSHAVDYAHWGASDSKLFVTQLLLEDLRAGKITMDTQLNWAASDRRDGAGIYDAAGSPLSGTVRDVLFDMLNRSGNTAVRVLVNKALGGADVVNERYFTEYPELKVTRLEPIAGTDKFYLGYTTAAEVDFILDKLYSATDDYAAFVKNALATNIFNDYGPRSQVKDTKDITVIDKMGELNDPEGNNRHDVGVIENALNGHKLRYVLLTTNYEPQAGPLTAEAEQSLQAYGRDMLLFEGDRMPHDVNQPQALSAPSAKHQIANGHMQY